MSDCCPLSSHTAQIPVAAQLVRKPTRRPSGRQFESNDHQDPPTLREPPQRHPQHNQAVLHGDQLQVGASCRSFGSTWNLTTAPLLSMYRSVNGDSRSTSPSYSSVGRSPSLSQYSPWKRSEIS